VFDNIYENRRVLVTGHTGFKGSWLTHWLTQLRADVTGLSLSPECSPNHWDLLQLECADVRGDIRDSFAVKAAVDTAAPEIVFHLAAQPLVRRSYRDPLETWSTNVQGTANVLEACRCADSVRAIVVVTTDKCYENQEQIWGYRECDRLGGHDPYSASKAAAELVATSYRKSYFSKDSAPLLATARAGNVIGGGDWSEDRLIPDAARAASLHQSLEIRSPHATRPWQHVLECLSGYLLLGQQLLQEKREFANAWNFGPGPDGNRTVASMLKTIQTHWPELQWHQTAVSNPHETTLLQLDSTRAHCLLGWQPVWTIDEGLAVTADWYRQYALDGNVATTDQLLRFVADAATLQRSWAVS
jgi:CDP-glucose 4,6-dehydratase